MSICRHQVPAERPIVYTTPGAFCRIFMENMDRLYLLAFLLTSNQDRAEQCFVAALECCVQGSPVFSDWAQTWSRRAVIKNAIRIVSPLFDRWNGVTKQVPDASEWRPAAMLDAVAQMADFERFVFVMSVLEKYSDQECSTLLKGTRKQVVSARARALRSLIAADESRLSRADIIPPVILWQAQ